jgi:hypothetical protein
MNEQTIYWVKTQLTNDEYASDEEMRAYFIEGGLTAEEADEWLAKRGFYRHNLVIEENAGNDIGIYDPNTRSVKPLTA